MTKIFISSFIWKNTWGLLGTYRIKPKGTLYYHLVEIPKVVKTDIFIFFLRKSPGGFHWFDVIVCLFCFVLQIVFYSISQMRWHLNNAVGRDGGLVVRDTNPHAVENPNLIIWSALVMGSSTSVVQATSESVALLQYLLKKIRI